MRKQAYNTAYVQQRNIVSVVPAPRPSVHDALETVERMPEVGRGYGLLPGTPDVKAWLREPENVVSPWKIGFLALQPGDTVTALCGYGDPWRLAVMQVGAVEPGPMVFGRGEDTRLYARLETAPGGGAEKIVALHGSVPDRFTSSLPGTSDASQDIVAGHYLEAGDGVVLGNQGRVKYCEVWRLDKRGIPQPVGMELLLNGLVESESFSFARHAWNGLSDLLKTDGFVFDQMADDVLATGGQYQKITNDLIIAAQRISRGGQEPTDVIWTYDAKGQVLRAMRSVCGKEFIQVAEAANVTAAMLQGALSHNDPWSKLAEDTPVVTHTWHGSSRDPAVTVLVSAEEQVSEKIQRPKGMGDMLSRVVLGTLRVDRSLLTQTTQLEVDILPGDRPQVRIHAMSSNPASEMGRSVEVISRADVGKADLYFGASALRDIALIPRGTIDVMGVIARRAFAG